MYAKPGTCIFSPGWNIAYEPLRVMVMSPFYVRVPLLRDEIVTGRPDLTRVLNLPAGKEKALAMDELLKKWSNRRIHSIEGSADSE
jgi:hypothetical protein